MGVVFLNIIGFLANCIFSNPNFSFLRILPSSLVLRPPLSALPQMCLEGGEPQLIHFNSVLSFRLCQDQHFINKSFTHRWVVEVVDDLQHRLLVYHVVVLDVGGKGLLNDGALAQQALYKIFIHCHCVVPYTVISSAYTSKVCVKVR